MIALRERLIAKIEAELAAADLSYHQSLAADRAEQRRRDAETIIESLMIHEDATYSPSFPHKIHLAGIGAYNEAGPYGLLVRWCSMARRSVQRLKSEGAAA